MSVQISGVLKDGAGKPVQDCTIQLSAKKTSPTVVVEVTSSTLTGADGHYSIEAEPGYYSVSLLREGFPPVLAGDIYVAPTDAPDTLNVFLDAPKDADLRPDVMKRFEEMVNRVVDLSGVTEKDRERAEQAAQSAAQSNDAAALSATAAAESQRQAAHSADAADVSAQSAADNARQTAQDVLVSGADADSAAKSAQAATEQAGEAKTAADTAQKAQQDAGASAQSSAVSAESAALSAQTAGEHAGNAAASETSARESALTATQAAEQGNNSAAAAAPPAIIPRLYEASDNDNAAGLPEKRRSTIRGVSTAPGPIASIARRWKKSGRVILLSDNTYLTPDTNEYEFINATKSYKGIIDIFNDYYEKKFSLTKETTYKNEYSKLIIDSLKSQGFDLVLATNPLFPRFVTEYRIKWAGLSPSDFKYITSYENSSFTKPKKEYYDEILTKLNIKREDVIYLGNDVDDDYGIIGVNYFSKSYLITDCLINKNNKNLDIEKITLKEFYQKIKA